MTNRHIHTLPRRIGCIMLFAAITACGARAQHLAALPDTLSSDRVVTHAQMVAVGGTRVLDTYLSPEDHTGTELRYISHLTRQVKGSQWTHQFVHQGDIATLHDRADKSEEWAGLYDFSYAMHRDWPLLGGRLHLKAGGQAEVGVGAIYNSRNQNNPAQLRLFAHLAPSGVVSYRFTALRMRCQVRYEVSVPLLGIMFSPNYGQSYYEISLGNYDHNAVATTVANAPSLRHMLTLDMRVRQGFILRVGYLGDIQQARVNNLRQHVDTHALLLGVVKTFTLLNIE